ncbi:hypothetical protein QBC34DRAFT_377210 [Podospora aff. communis PSN243]|uniref:F-box domain-containing protein n=1 Tax=Podospora aff. communis PSN243 TaxID=3040156 RepID=A0AAV9GYE5_9PEZI|nr:hypothetical protein QBC34DRAFT_377210 [Podospora aff. communis PSN243]
MATLDMLPVETLQQIFLSLSSTDLRALCRTNSSLCNVAQPLLYSSVELTWKESHKLAWKESHTPPIAPLLSTLPRRPDLAGNVKKLKMDGDAFVGDWFLSRQPPKISIAEEHSIEFTTYIDDLQLPNRDDWVAALQQGTMGVLVALVVSRLQNLSSLHLESGVIKESRFLGEMLAFALCEPEHNGKIPTFERLSDVTFLPALPGDGWVMPGNTKDALTLFYLPNLKSLNARLDNPMHFTWPASGAPPACDNLTSMKVSGIREGRPLDHLLRATQYLEALDWELWYDPIAHENQHRHHRYSTTVIDLDHIAAGLSHVRATLRSLRISVACGQNDYGDYPDLNVQGSLDGLRSFQTLTHLEIPLILLIGTRRDERDRLDTCFPADLEYLTINDDGWHYGDYDLPDVVVFPLIEAWLARWATWTPRLRKFTWLLNITDEDWGPAEREQLRNACLLTGMDVEIIRREPDFPRLSY